MSSLEEMFNLSPQDACFNCCLNYLLLWLSRLTKNKIRAKQKLMRLRSFVAKDVALRRKINERL